MQNFLFNRVAGLLPAWVRNKGAILCTATAALVGVWCAPAHAGQVNPTIKDSDFSYCHIVLCDDKGNSDKPDFKITGDFNYDDKGVDCRGKFDIEVCYGDKHETHCLETYDCKGKEYTLCDSHNLIDCEKFSKDDCKYSFDCGDKDHKKCKEIEICYHDPCCKKPCDKAPPATVVVPTPASAEGAVALFAAVGAWRFFRRNSGGLKLA